MICVVFISIFITQIDYTSGGKHEIEMVGFLFDMYSLSMWIVGNQIQDVNISKTVPIGAIRF